MHTDTWVLPRETFAARVQGRCVCGAVSWSYDAPFSTMLYCHCSVCRKHHGTLFATTVVGPLDTFHWRSGTEKIGTWLSSAQERRAFCALCGAKVPRVEHDSQRVFMPAGALEGELGLRPQLHLFVGSKPPWHVLTDGLPRHQAYPPGWPASAVDGPARITRDGVTSGSCACGRVHFELDGRALVMMHCHCSRCRQARGTAHATNLAWKLDALRYTRGEQLLGDFDLPGARHFGTTFCSHCGGFVPRRSPGRGVVVVPVGSMDTDPQVTAFAHQFVASKAPWFDITDGTPQFPEAAPRPSQ
jgi:hypothetical protein